MEDRFLRASLPLSVLAHVLLFASAAVWIAVQPRLPVKRPPIIIEVDDLTQQQPKIQNKVVQSTEGREAEEAAEDAFLGEKTRIVDRQTVSGDSRSLQERHSQTRKKNDGSESETQGQSGKDAGLKSLGRLGAPILPPPGAMAKREPDQPDWALPSDDPLDYAPDVAKGDRTALNTKEFIYYGYFQRVRGLLDRAWESHLIDRIRKMYRSGRRLASKRNHLTRTVVTLDRKGDVVRVEILEESGVHELDDTTVRAFNDAGPFPNPPVGLIGDDGLVRIRWDFVLRT